MNRIVPQALIRQTQQVIGKSIAGVLTVEVEHAFRAAGAVSGQQIQVLILISRHHGVLSPDLAQADVAVDALLLEDSRVAPSIPGADTGVTGNRNDIRKADPFFAARGLEALNPGLL